MGHKTTSCTCLQMNLGDNGLVQCGKHWNVLVHKSFCYTITCLSKLILEPYKTIIKCRINISISVCVFVNSRYVYYFSKNLRMWIPAKTLNTLVVSDKQ